MAQKVLGLDIGSYSVKAALFETTFRLYELTDLFESTPLQMDELDAADKPVVISEAIIRLMEENNISPSTIVTALPGMNVSTRLMTLPLPPKQLAKVLPFELESFLPFDLDEILVDHYLISTSKAATTCLAAAAQKSSMAEHLSIVRAAKLEPAFVGLDSLMLHNLNLMTFAHQEGTYAIVDIGHQKTSICVVSNRRLLFVRTLFNAGLSMTNTIREDLDLTLDQALEVKHNHAILELENRPLQSKDLRRLSSAIQKTVDPLIRDLLQTFNAYRAQDIDGESPPPVEHVFLCGGGSLVRNLPEYITSVTNLKASRVHLFPQGNEVSERLGPREHVFAQAVALGLRAAVRGPETKNIAHMNFRQGEFSFARDMSGIKNKILFFGKWILVVFILAMLHVGVKYNNLAQQRNEIESTFFKQFRTVIREEKGIPNQSSAALRILQSRVAANRERQELLTAGLNEMTALGVLRELSTLIPNNIVLDTQELSIDRNQVTIRGTTDSIASRDQIVSALKKNANFSNIETGDIREAPDGKKSFQINITIGEDEAASQTKRRRK